MIHFTADYQKYVTAGDAIKKCDDGMTAIKEELESAGLGNNINQNKAYNRLLREKVGAIKERNKYAQRIFFKDAIVFTSLIFYYPYAW